MTDKQASQHKENTTIKVIILLGECRYPTLVLVCGLNLKQSSENLKMICTISFISQNLTSYMFYFFLLYMESSIEMSFLLTASTPRI